VSTEKIKKSRKIPLKYGEIGYNSAKERRENCKENAEAPSKPVHFLKGYMDV